jgi:hypothetical protein
MLLPTIETIIAAPIGRTDRAPAEDTTIPAIVAPFADAGCDDALREGADGDGGVLLLPQAAPANAATTGNGAHTHTKTLRIPVLHRDEFTVGRHVPTRSTMKNDSSA